MLVLELGQEGKEHTRQEATMKQWTGPRHQAGDTVIWGSQANGTWLKKRGKIIAVVHAGRDLDTIWKMLNPDPARKIPSALRRAAMISDKDRYLVELTHIDRHNRTTQKMELYKVKAPRFYVPLAKGVDSGELGAT